MYKSFRRLAAAAAVSLLSACGVGHTLSHQLLGTDATAAPGTTPSIFGYAVADEPQAAIAARAILNQGGNAADAAAAAGFALAVTLPSRAGLGGGGACLIKMPDAAGTMQPPIALLFPAGAPAAANGDRPAAIPTLARGLLAMQARYGQLPPSQIITPAERLAASAQLSPALESDLQIAGPALLADPAAAAVFAPQGTLLPANATLAQPDLATALETLRTQGVQGFYAGSFAENFVQAADAAGGGLTTADLASATPQFTAPASSSRNGYAVASLPLSPTAAAALPASAGFATLDKNGGSVTCVTSMNNLFGTGRIAAGTGILLAASPRSTPTPELAATIAYTPTTNAFRAATTGTGQTEAAAAAQIALTNALTNTATPIPPPGRANTISCPATIPGGEASCTATTDPTGQGLAIGGR